MQNLGGWKGWHHLHPGRQDYDDRTLTADASRLGRRITCNIKIYARQLSFDSRAAMPPEPWVGSRGSNSPKRKGIS